MLFLSFLRNKLAYFFFLINKAGERVAYEKRYNLLLKSFSSVGSNCWFQYYDYFIQGQKYIKIGNYFSVGRYFRMEAIDIYNGRCYSPRIVIGDNVRIEDYCHIGCVNSITIGNGVLIASKVFVTDHFHGDISQKDLELIPKERPLSSKAVVIGNNVWIGDSVSIMPGVTLGNNVIVGANSVVTHSFPANVVIAGSPAKIIKVLDK